MLSIRWLEKRRSYWQRLEDLVKRSKSGVGQLSHSELQELGLLYRQTASDLSTALEDKSSAQLAAYLNQLLARAHNLIYAGQKAKANGVLAFYRETFPRTFHEVWTPTLIATVVFIVTALAGWLITLSDPTFAYRILGRPMMDTIEHKQMWTHSIVTVKPLAASAITTNNLTVAFTVFALGITVIGALWMLALNGVMLGVVGAATWKAGMATSLWSFVAPHGSLELPAILIAGGAGLELARGLLFPGLLPRRESLSRAGARASKLLLGSVPLLLIAGAIEGFFSPTDAPMAMKFILGAVLFAVLIAYLAGATLRRKSTKATADSGL